MDCYEPPVKEERALALCVYRDHAFFYRSARAVAWCDGGESLPAVDEAQLAHPRVQHLRVLGMLVDDAVSSAHAQAPPAHDDLGLMALRDASRRERATCRSFAQ